MTTHTRTSQMTGSPAPLRYTLPAPAGAVLLGLHRSTLTGLGVTATAVVLLMLAKTPLWAVVPLAVLGASLCALPIAGRTLLGWTPTGARHLLRHLTGAHTNTRVLPTTRVESPASDREQALRIPTLKASLGVGPRHLRLSEHKDTDGVPVGILTSRRHDQRTIVLEVTGPGRFGLLDPHAQDSELSRWGSALASLCADPQITNVQWLSHTRPDTTCPSRQDLGDPAAFDGAHQDYQQLVADVRSRALQHRHLIALTLRSDNAGGRYAGLSHLREHTATLLGADLLSYPLSAAELGSALRMLLDPAQPDHGPLTDPASWAAVASRSGWSHCHSDDTVHRGYAVCGWPRLALSADWLTPLLQNAPPAGTARTLSLHARPVPPAAAARRARAETARVRLDAHDRTRLGFTPAAADELDLDDATCTEAELVAGYRLCELSGVLVISAPDLAQLEDAGQLLRAHAGAHHLDLRPLHGRHQHALAAALPLGLHPGGAR
jgi:hypothetical protein